MRQHGRFFVFAAVSVALTLWIAGQIVGFERGTDRYALRAVFEDATGLKQGNPVELAGVPIGRVTAVRVERGTAAVSFTVDRDVPLPVDSVVSVRSQDLIGRRKLRIDPGTATTMLTDGATVELTQSSVELGALINELGPLLEAVRPEQVNQLVNGLNDALSGNRETLSGIAVDLGTLLDTLASRSASIEQLTDDYGVLVAEVAQRDRSIQRLLENLVLLAETFDASDALLADALDTVPGVADDLEALLTASGDDLDSLLDDLVLVAGELDPRIDTLDEITSGLPFTLAQIWTLVDGGEFGRINFNCVATTYPPCPHPVTGDGDDPADEVANAVDDLTELLTGLLSP